MPALVAALTAVEFTVAFGGFPPGFGYLSGLPAELHCRAGPAAHRVPAGCVGIAGQYAGVYPRASPGGWQLVGRTSRNSSTSTGEPTLLRPGARVRFRRSKACSPCWRRGRSRRCRSTGNAGWASVGVRRSGAADRSAAGLANRLVGNAPAAAVLEVTAGGLGLRAERAVLIAVTGAPAPVGIDGRRGPFNAPLSMPAGAVLTLGVPTAGLRTYVAVRGGVDVPAVLGSRGTDMLSGLGPAPLEAGDRLPLGALAAADPNVDLAAVEIPDNRTGGTCSAPAAARLACFRRVDGADHEAGTSQPTATGWGCGWTAGASSGRGRTNCSARVSCPEPSRCRPTANPCCSSPTTR